MSTSKQVVANRQNATKSTGPKSTQGKVLASRNATCHGLLAIESILPWETYADFDQHKLRLMDHFLPQGPFEQLLVERIISLFWRLRRIGIIESGIFALKRYQQEYDQAEKCADSLGRLTCQLQRLREAANSPGYKDPGISEVELVAWLNIAEKKELLNTDLVRLAKNFVDGAEALSNLHRYETGIERSLFKNLHELQRLQATRSGQAVPVPLAIDLHGDHGSG
jgi:hypothetical protein